MREEWWQLPARDQAAHIVRAVCIQLDGHRGSLVTISGSAVYQVLARREMASVRVLVTYWLKLLCRMLGCRIRRTGGRYRYTFHTMDLVAACRRMDQTAEELASIAQ